MSRSPVGVAGHPKLAGGRHVAHIPHVGGARHIFVDSEIGSDFLYQGRVPELLPVRVRQVDPHHSGGLLIFRILIPEGPCQRLVLRVKLRRPRQIEGLHKQAADRVVGDEVAHSRGDIDVALRAGHQRRASGHILHPLQYLDGQSHFGRADVILQAGVGVDHVGGLLACILVGIVHAHLRGHMLPQIVHAHIHQLAGVQGAAPQMGSRRRVGAPPAEGKIYADIGVGAVALDRIAVSRMPGKTGIHILEIAVPGQKHFRPSGFLTGAAKHLHRACAGMFL